MPLFSFVLKQALPIILYHAIETHNILICEFYFFLAKKFHPIAECFLFLDLAVFIVQIYSICNTVRSKVSILQDLIEGFRFFYHISCLKAFLWPDFLQGLRL